MVEAKVSRIHYMELKDLEHTVIGSSLDCNGRIHYMELKDLCTLNVVQELEEIESITWS